jgi:hypothetical protein
VVLALAALPAWAHPKPGAHADVRITVTPTDVRVDLVMNLMFVDGLVQSNRARPDDITPEEEARVREGLRQYFSAHADGLGTGGVGARAEAGINRLIDRGNTVRIDGVVVAPIEREFAVVHPEAESRPGFEQNPLLLIPQVHLTLEYACKSAPERVEVVWGTFPLDFLAQGRDNPPPGQVEAVLVAPGGVQEVVLTQAEPSYTWHNPGKPVLARPPAVVERDGGAVPVLSVLLGAAWVGWVAVGVARRGRMPRGSVAVLAPVVAGTWLLMPVARVSLRAPMERPGEEEARGIFRALHANIYRAFDYTTEGEIYDALAQSVDGGLLEALYARVYTSLVMFEEGGAVSRVKSLTAMGESVETAEVVGPAGSFRVRARWRVEGVVYHWGHSHTRVSEYLALYDVAPTSAGWRIIGVTALEQFRVGASGEKEAEKGTAPSAWHPNR